VGDAVIGPVLAEALTRSMGALASGGFNWWQQLPGWDPDSLYGRALHLAHPGEAWVIPATWFGVLLLLGLAWVARRGIQSALDRPGAAKYVPDSGLTVRNAFEILVEGLMGLFGGNLNAKDRAYYFPFLATIFTTIFVSNLLGFVPGVVPITENFSSNFAMALAVFLVFNIAGIARNGTGYVKHLWGPKLPFVMIPVNVIILLVETFGLFVRPATLTVRLTANIFADHLVAGVIRGIGGGTDSLAGMIMGAILPLPFYALGLLVCFLQAFVFTLLSTIYIGLAVAHDEGHADADHHH
jgi:F-type H+-transporting ATPase subunit a